MRRMNILAEPKKKLMRFWEFKNKKGWAKWNFYKNLHKPTDRQAEKMK